MQRMPLRWDRDAVCRIQLPAASSHTLSVAFSFVGAASLFVSLVYCAESTVRWFVVREKHCRMAADCADKSKRTGRLCAMTRAWNPA
jgi:hypothetical protein